MEDFNFINTMIEIAIGIGGPLLVRRRYGRAWKRIRDSYVKSHPFCELCYEKGVLVRTEEVHHKKPLSEGGTHEKENLIALCKVCHSRLHANRGDRFNKNREHIY